ncbi:hypothetical protein NP233_g2452 [Leucocoprinus birnbaumii]|uniref:Uncharacterized protein n=1 Tax=Leucocoprinus birnbaumii TaxID=56174 RepID=A0AAD5W1D9_9AGAR|nr:hypothetical protein NP233_g2452 [Leucocoprinus birnbaumii]
MRHDLQLSRVIDPIPSLRSLALDGYPSDILSFFSVPSAFPNLSSLVLRPVDEPPPPHFWAKLFEGIASSSKILENLTLDAIDGFDLPLSIDTLKSLFKTPLRKLEVWNIGHEFRPLDFALLEIISMHRCLRSISIHLTIDPLLVPLQESEQLQKIARISRPRSQLEMLDLGHVAFKTNPTKATVTLVRNLIALFPTLVKLPGKVFNGTDLNDHFSAYKMAFLDAHLLHSRLLEPMLEYTSPPLELNPDPTIQAIMHKTPSFNRTELLMEQREFRSLNVTEVAVEATPIDGKIENVLKWTVTLEVDHHPTFGDGGATCVLLKDASCIDLDVGLRTDKFWWRTKLRPRPHGLITSFSEIISFLEEDRQRFETQVDSKTLEGTYFWVWEQLRALDMGGYLISKLLPGYLGEYQSALSEFADAISWWKPAYDLVLIETKERIAGEAVVKLKTEEETEARSARY